MKHVRTLTKTPVVAQDQPNLPFIIATLQFLLTILQALQTKKATETQLP